MDSKLQIISGAHRGRKLYLPAGARPTQNMARAALFNILNGIVDFNAEMVVWDAFAGSGAWGLEFLSRGASAKVIFTDNSADSLAVVRKNLALIGGVATVRNTDAIAVISEFGAVADVVFIDPPYADFDKGVDFIKKITPVAKESAILIWEFDKTAGALPDFGDDWRFLRDRIYGRARFVILSRVRNK